jgi:hypothetical protein
MSVERLQHDPQMMAVIAENALFRDRGDEGGLKVRTARMPRPRGNESAEDTSNDRKDGELP